MSAPKNPGGSALDKLLVALTSQIRSTSLKEGAIDEHLIRLIHAYGTSDDQIHRLDVCQQLTRELWVRWNDHTDELALEGCVEMGRELLELLPGHTELNKHLANCLYTLSKRTGAVALIEEAIRLERVVLALYPTGHANRASSCASLAASLFVHFDHTGDTSSLEESIQLEREALSLLKTDHPDYSASSVSLAAALHARFELTGIASLLDEAIQLARDLLSLYPDHPRREIMCTNLATFLQSQFDRTGGSKIIEEVIRMRREVLTLRPIGDPNRAYACGYLGIALHAQFEITGNTALLDEAKQLHEEELSLRSVDHPKLRAETCAHFAALLRARFYTTGNMEELERAVQLNREALSLCPVGRPDRGRFCGSLAASLTVYIEHVAVDTSFLVEATALAREAVALFPSTSSSYPDACRNLANLEYYSYLQTGDFDALEEAIRLQREATSMCAWDHPDRAYSCSRLARLLLAYFEHTGGMAWCDEAIQLTREALSLEPAQVPSHAVRCTDLSESLLKRYQQTLDESVLHEAIQLQRRALAQPSTAHRNHTTMRANLARSLLYEHDCTGNMAALDEEIELRREVLEARPPGHPDRAVSALNLAMSLYRHARLRRNTDELKEATEWNRHTLALLPAGHPQRAMACCCLAEELHRMSTASIGHASLLREESRDLWNESLSSRPPGHPDRWESMLGIAEIASYYQDHTAVIDSLSDAMGSPPYDGIPAFVSSVVTLLTLVDISVIDQARRQVMLQLCSNALGLVVLVADLALDHAAQLPHTRKGSSLGPLAFHIGVLAENLPGGLAVLERARGIIWSLTLQLRNPQLDRVPADLAAKLSMLIPGTSADTISEVPGTSFLPERDLQYEHRSRRQQVLRDIRSLPGLGDFMRGPDVSALLAAAARNPVVILVAGKAECHALIIASPQEPLVALAIPELHATALQNLRFGPNMPSQRGSTADSDQRLGIKVSKLASHTAMMLEKLWKLVVRPVLARLGFKKCDSASKPRIHWCMTGAFSFFPIHAAGIYEGSDQECCSDHVVSSYTPTMTSLLQAQQDVQVPTTNQLKLLLVAAEYAQDPSLPRLRFVGQETREIAEIADRSRVSLSSLEPTAVASEVITALELAHIVHFACHGVQHGSQPHKSHFCLRNSYLTVEDLMKADLKNAFFAFLSACETAKGDQTYADETVHLAATMLFAGFRSVVATMWAMNDRDGPFVAKRFYEKLFECETIDVDAVPRALDHAVQALRESGATPERWATFIHMGA